MNGFHCSVFITCMLALFGETCLAQLRGLVADTASYVLWYAIPEEKVRYSDALPPGPAVVPTLRCARRESEAVQLVVTPKTNLAQLEVLCGAPVQATNVLPMPEIRRVAYVRLTVNTYANYTPNPAQWLGWVPDPLPAYAVTSATAGEHAAYWVTYTVPTAAPSGEYNAPVVIRAQGVAPATYTVRLRVRQFVLPLETHLATALDSGHFASRYDDNPNDGDPGISIYDFHGVTTTADRNRLVKAYYDDYARHRLSPYNFGHGFGISAQWDRTTEAYVFNFTNFDARLAPYLDDGGFQRFMVAHGHDMQTFTVSFVGGGSTTYSQARPEDIPFYDRYVVAYWTGVTQHLRQRGWLEKAYIMLDEPDPEDYDYVRHFMDLIKNQVTPELKVGPAIWLHGPNNLDKRLEGAINLWIPLNDERWSNYEPAYLNQRQALGEEIWWYYITTEHFNIDGPGVCHRSWAWKAWRYKISGLLTWAGLIWDTHALRNVWNPQNTWDYNNPWLKPASPWGNGAIAFYYPPNPAGPSPVPRFDLVPSLRWEIMRESMEDYEYFYLLRDEITRAKQEGRPWAEAQAALDAAMALVTSQTRTSYDTTAFRDRRDRVGDQIERLQARNLLEVR